MAYRIRNPEREQDDALKDDLALYMKQNLNQKEVFDLVKKKYPEYAWSLQSLSRRLQHLRIKYVDYDISISTVKEFVTCFGFFDYSGLSSLSFSRRQYLLHV